MAEAWLRSLRAPCKLVQFGLKICPKLCAIKSWRDRRLSTDAAVRILIDPGGSVIVLATA
jgi:hypothetical protein